MCHLYGSHKVCSYNYCTISNLRRWKFHEKQITHSDLTIAFTNLVINSKQFHNLSYENFWCNTTQKADFKTHLITKGLTNCRVDKIWSISDARLFIPMQYKSW